MKPEKYTYAKKSKSSRITCRRNNQLVPTSTPGIGPKWDGGTVLHSLVLPTQAMPFPQSRLDLDVDSGVFFFDFFNFSPALTISFSSFLQDGQYLKQ